MKFIVQVDTVMKRRRGHYSVIVAIAALLFGSNLGSSAAGQTPRTLPAKTISLGTVSEKYHKEIKKHYRDFVRHVAQKLSSTSDVEGKIVIAPTLLQLVELIEQKKVDFYMESPYPTYVVNTVHGAGKLLLRRWKGGKAGYRSLIFTKKDSGINRLEDLRGKIIVFEDPESSSGHFLPKFFLLKRGFKLSKQSGLEANVSPGEVGYIFAYSQVKLVDLVLTKQVAAGAFSDNDYDALDNKTRSEIGVLARTTVFPRHLLSVRKDLAPELVDRLREVLLSMHQNVEGRRILKKTGGTTKFDILPGGEEGVRRRLLESFFSPEIR